MSLPGNGIFVVQGEMNMLVTALRRSSRWGSHSFANDEYDLLMRAFQDLKTILNNVGDLRLLDPATYLGPFLEVIRNKDTTGPVTNSALSAINKFLSYGLIDPTHPSVPATVEDIADAVTHARFVGTDHSADGIVLTNILQVLRTLMMSPEGALLTDESVCEIMLTCFRIFFETRLIELLRRNAEQCLRDMTQLIFMRLPQFCPEDLNSSTSFNSIGLSLKKRDKNIKKKGGNQEIKSGNDQSQSNTDDSKDTLPKKKIPVKIDINEAAITIEPEEPMMPMKKHVRHSSMDLASNGNTSITQLLEKCVNSEKAAEKTTESTEVESDKEELLPKEEEEKAEEVDKLEEYVNHRGIRFTPQDEVPNLQPYGLGCVRELLKFLISLCNPHDELNTPSMIYLGLCLLDTALEVSGDHMGTCPSLLLLIKDPLCRNLLSLLGTEKISIFTINLQVSFLLFESLRFHLKYQMEAYFKKIIEIISTDTTKVLRLKELHHVALESLAQMFRIPGLCTELYLNYDCDIYCTNIFEELTKILSKNVVSSTASNIHILSLEALMTIIEAIENASIQKTESISNLKTVIESKFEVNEPKFGRGGHVSLELGGMDDMTGGNDVTHDISQYAGIVRVGRHTIVSEIPSEAELDNIKNTKKWITSGTELFNQKPERGIEFLQEHGVLATPLVPHQVAMFLRENPDLDKKQIGDYICKRSSSEDEESHTVLSAFASSFDFTGLRIDTALRMYLESFRLPGEAPLIFLVMEKFADQWHTSNGEPFANTDAAFRLAYAVIMLNMDQHNHNAKKLNVPMNVEDFVKNLRGLNGNEDFDQSMLEAIFNAIKNEEMVMPAERIGLVREAYLWRVLQRRGVNAAYLTAPALQHHRRLFNEAVAPTVTALSAAFERSTPPSQEDIENHNIRDNVALLALTGLERCATLIARQAQHAMPEQITLDTLLLTLCKFTGLLLPPYNNYIAIGVTLGQSTKAQLALRRAFTVCARHADNVREAWKHLMEIIKALYIGKLLPKALVEAEDYLSPSGIVSLIREASSRDAGLLSSIYSYISLGESAPRTPSVHERAVILAASNTVEACNLNTLLTTETKFLHLESLQELVRAMVTVGAPPDAESLQMNPQLEDITIFFLELLGQTLIQNRDRLQSVWSVSGAHIQSVVFWSINNPSSQYLAPRTLTALLRTSARLMRSEHCAPLVLSNLTMLLTLPYKLFYMQADIISCGLYELVKTSAQNVHSGSDWDIVFSLLCAAGAGVWPKDIAGTASPTTSSRSEGSEDENEKRPTSVTSDNELSQSPHTQGWILVNNKDLTEKYSSCTFDDVYFRPHLSSALCRCTEALALVIRDVAHVTPENVRAAVRAVRLFATAATNTRKKSSKNKENRKSRSSRRKETSDDEDDTNDQYYLVSMQLLDLMHTLHSRTAQIFRWWKEEAEQNQSSDDLDLWDIAWMPLLQGIAQFCTDPRKQVASSAIAYLQRALLAPALVSASRGWEACFIHVLFPLLQSVKPRDKARANTILCKVFLHHLSALSSRPTFASLWVRVISAQRSLVENCPPDDPLTEAALESLKNMILVMDSVKIFSNGEGYTELWHLTWEKIGEFLPHLKEELFREAKPAKSPPPLQSPVAPQSAPIPPPNPPSYPTGTQSAFVAYHNSSAAKSGMVPIRNPLYTQTGLASSVLLQPLNEMVATSLSMTLPSQMPILLPSSIDNNTVTTQSIDTLSINPTIDRPTPLPKYILDTIEKQITTQVTDTNLLNTTNYLDNNTQTTTDSNYIIDIPIENPKPELTKTELYDEYISNPYNESEKSAMPLNLSEISTLPLNLSERSTLALNLSERSTLALNSSEKTVLPPIFSEKKSISMDSSPMHRNLTNFGSSDNVKKDESLFNFSNYFGSVSNVPPGSEILFGDSSIPREG